MQKPGASEDLTKAAQLFQSGEREAALEIVENIISSDAGNAAAWQTLGLLMLRSGRANDGIKALRRACTLAPFEPGNYTDLGLAYLEIADYPRAEACLISAQSLGPADANVEKMLAHARHMAGTGNAATGALAKSVDGDAEAHYAKALEFQRLNSVDGVIENLRKVARLLPAFAAAHKSLADFLWHSHGLRALTGAFGALLELKGEDAGIADQAGEAELHYRMALYHDPDLSEANAYFGNLLRRNGKLSEARECYRQAAEMRPANAVTQANFASLLLALGELDEAGKYADLALKLEPGFAEARELQGHILLAQGDGPAAARKYLDTFRFDPKVSSELFT